MKKKFSGIAKEHFSTAFQVTASSSEEGTFKGIAAAFGTRIDSWCPTVIVKGAFTKTLRENGRRFRILNQHDTDEPLARPGLGINPGDMLAETDIGLMVGAKISKTSCGLDCITLLRDRVIDEMSIGFDPIRTEMLPLSQAIAAGLILNPSEWSDIGTEEMIRVLREVRLWEASLVTWGANAAAVITEANALTGELGLIPRAKLASMILSSDKPVMVTVEEFQQVQFETHEGKVLSSKNRSLVSDAMSSIDTTKVALQALLDAAEPPPPPSPDGTNLALTAQMEREQTLRELQLAFV